MTVRITTAEQSIAREAEVIARAPDASYLLMKKVGERMAADLLRRYPQLRTRGALVFPGAGNNGGDAWVVASELAKSGCPVDVDATMAEFRLPKSEAAQRAKAEALEALRAAPRAEDALVLLDGILGVGVSGEVRGEAVQEIERINAYAADSALRESERGDPRAVVVSIDLPSGIDATTGAGGTVVKADLTYAIDSLHRGLLLRRDEAGEVAVLSLYDGGNDLEEAPALIDAVSVRAAIPPIPADAHKGVRRRLAIVGGGEGMAGAPMLAARGAMRSGIGMVQLLVSPNNVPVVQAALPETMAARWPVTSEDQTRVLGWAHTLLLGPGLGRTAMTRALVERLLVDWKGPVVLDADALNVFEGEPRMLGSLLGARPAIVTPHPVEAGRLLRRDGASVAADRFTVGAELAKQLGATVVLKGVPTVISAPDGRVAVSAAGSPTLGTAGSGDVLSGIVATLLAQTGDPFAASCAAVWVHGRAGERAAAQGSVRGTSLEDVVVALRDVWRLDDPPPPRHILAELPAAGRVR
jgi:hydroxyethylthiazole kinase-like uncharacterized protein yjeF